MIEALNKSEPSTVNTALKSYFSAVFTVEGSGALPVHLQRLADNNVESPGIGGVTTQLLKEIVE